MSKELGFWILGAYSCWLCKKTFNAEIKIDKATHEKHEEAHYTRFMRAMCSAEQFKSVFYQYCRDEITYATLINM